MRKTDKMKFIELIFLFAVICGSSACPEKCACKWKGGKEWVECLDLQLPAIPSGIDPQAQVLDLSGNIFTTLKSKMFQQKGLVNLQKIYLSRCNVEDVHSEAFHQITNLIELDLSSNTLSYIPTEPFRDTPQLRKLHLGHNSIAVLSEDSFANLPKLTMLDLAGNHIHSVQKGAFNNLMHLEILKLDKNRLFSLDMDVLQPLTKLSGLHLNSNPWNCDCHLRPIRLWMRDMNVPLGIPPTCKRPQKLLDVTWDVLELQDFACQPKLFSNSTHLNADEGSNVTLLCRMDSDPPGIVSWSEATTQNTTGFFPASKYVIKEDARGSSLTIINVEQEDESIFTCLGSNEAGKTSLNFTLRILPKPLALVALSKGQIAGIVLLACFLLLSLIVLISILLIRKRISRTGQQHKFRNLGFIKILGKKKAETMEIPAKDSFGGHMVDKIGTNGINGDTQTPDLIHDKMNNGNCNGISRDDPTQDDMWREKALFEDDQWSLQRAQPALYQESLRRTIQPRYNESSPNAGHPEGPYYDDFSGTPRGGSPSEYSGYGPRSPIQSTHLGRSLEGSLHPESGSVLNEYGLGYNRPPLGLDYGDTYPPPRNTYVTWKRSPLVVSHFPPHQSSVSPDEGYAEEALEGTEV